MHLAYGTNSWSSRGKLSKWLQLCTQPQETPLGSNKHRNKCTKQGLKKEHVPIKQAVKLPAPPSHWTSPCLAQLDSSSGDELADHMAKLKTLLGGKRRCWGLVQGVAQVSPHPASHRQFPTSSSSPVLRGMLPARRRAVCWYVGHPQRGLSRTPGAHIGLRLHLKKNRLGV